MVDINFGFYRLPIYILKLQYNLFSDFYLFNSINLSDYAFKLLSKDDLIMTFFIFYKRICSLSFTWK